MKKFIFFLISIFYLTAHSQQWKWAFSNHDGHGGAVVFDKSGDLLLSGNSSLFIEKFSSSGDSLWQKFIGSGFASPHNMALGKDSSIFLVGHGYGDSFITKCDKSGNVVWNFMAGGSQYSWNAAHSVAIDSQGNCYASGIYDQSTPITFNNCSLEKGGFVLKFSPQGNCLWSMYIPTWGNYYPNATLDNNDELIVSTRDSVLKVSNDQIQWVVHIAELKSVYPPNVSEVNTDSANNIYFVVYGDSIRVGQQTHKISPQHGLLVKLTPAGSIIWMKELSGPGELIFIDKAIYLTSAYDTRIQKISLDGDSVWCRTLTASLPGYFHISNISGSDNGLIAITGEIGVGTLKDGNDTLISRHYGTGPFVAVMQDTAFVGNTRIDTVEDPGFTIYPNPSSGTFILKLLKSQPTARIIIRDVLGNFLFDKNYQNLLSKEINFNGHPRGIYFIEVVSNAKRITSKLIID